MTNDDEHLFVCLMVISISPWRNIYSNLSHSLKLGWLLDLQSSLYIMNTNKYMVCKYFSHCLVVQLVKESACNEEDLGSIPGL